MYHEIREALRKAVEDAAGEEIPVEDIGESEKADLSCTSCFRLASRKKKNPADIAAEIAAGIKLPANVKKAEAAGGYVNFYLDYNLIAAPLLSEIKKEGARYGCGKKKTEKIVLEHTSINPSGPLHIGRLRNCLIGDSIARLLRFSGYEVETHYFVNDVGKQIAIIARGFAEGIEPDADSASNYGEYKDKEDFKIFFEYVAANRRYEEDPAFSARVQEHIQKAEGGDYSALDEITSVAKRCLAGQKEIFDFLDVRFDSFDYESQYIRNGDVAKVLEFLGGTKYAVRDEKGLGLDLSQFGIVRREGASVLSRSDGTSVYLCRDIAYHLYKVGCGDVLINVLGEDHKFEFRELATILSGIYGIKKPLEVVHYSFVSFEGMELSTRKGQTAPIDKLLDEACAKAEEEIEKRGIATKEVAPAIASGAVKYHILKTSPQKQMAFRWDEALSFDGDAAPYIQYAHARCSSILRKADAEPPANDGKTATGLERYEEALLRDLLLFPHVVSNAASGRKPNMVCVFLYALSSDFSRFYKECPVLSEGGAVRERRLALVASVRQVVANGLLLLGISAPERM